MNYIERYLFKVRDLIAMMPVTNYPFLDNYAANFIKFQTTSLQELRKKNKELAANKVAQFAFKASILTAFSLIQNKYDFSDEEFGSVLEIENQKNLQKLKQGKFEEVFVEAFRDSKFDPKFHNILIKAFDFMVIEFKDWKKLTSIINQITFKLDNHEQDFESIEIASRQPALTKSVKPE